MLNNLWQELGALQGKKISDFDTFCVFHSADGRTLHCYADLERLEEELLELFPPGPRGREGGAGRGAFGVRLL